MHAGYFFAKIGVALENFVESIETKAFWCTAKHVATPTFVICELQLIGLYFAPT